MKKRDGYFQLTTPPKFGKLGILPALNKTKIKKVMIKFGKYAGADGQSELTEVGTLKEVIGKKGKLGFIRKNFNDPTKRVALLLTRANGDTAIVSCSKQVSEAIRKHEIKLAQLLGFKVIENKDEVAFVAMPASGAIQSCDVDSIKVEEVAETEGNFLPEELVAL